MKRPTTHLVALHIVLVPCLTTYLILQISEAYNKEETEEQSENSQENLRPLIIFHIIFAHDVPTTHS